MARNRGFRPTASLVGGREIELILGPHRRYTAEGAVGEGLISRVKVEGVWLYSPPDLSFEDIEHQVLDGCLDLCRDWVLAPMPPLAGKVAKELGGGRFVTMTAVRPLLRLFVRRGELAALPALTNEYEPYLLVHDPSDADHLTELLTQAVTQLEQRGRLSGRDIGAAPRLTSAQAWKGLLLSHLEWRLNGSRTEGGLIKWDRI